MPRRRRRPSCAHASLGRRVNGWRSWESQGHKSKMPKVKEEKRKDGSSGYNAGNDEAGEQYKKDWR